MNTMHASLPPPHLFPTSFFFSNEWSMAGYKATKEANLTWQKNHIFGTFVETNQGVLPSSAFVPFIFHLKFHLAFRTLASIKYKSLVFLCFFFFPSHSILLAISGTAHSMAYFYHLDCLCLVTSSAFLNDWSEEHLKTPFISLIAKIKKNYQMKNFLTRMILHDSK